MAWVILLLASLAVPILLIRFRKRWVAAFNLIVTNRITSRFAARLPGFGILTHVGRKSGRVYRTPVNVFRAPEGYLIALTYGRDSEWARNVLAAGGCQLETRRVRYQLSAPTIVHDPARRRLYDDVRTPCAHSSCVAESLLDAATGEATRFRTVGTRRREFKRRVGCWHFPLLPVETAFSFRSALARPRNPTACYVGFACSYRHDSWRCCCRSRGSQVADRHRRDSVGAAAGCWHYGQFCGLN
jgi:deazaflavin-dependent oxidoreductase (nitroreductase family)